MIKTYCYENVSSDLSEGRCTKDFESWICNYYLYWGLRSYSNDYFREKIDMYTKICCSRFDLGFDDFKYKLLQFSCPLYPEDVKEDESFDFKYILIETIPYYYIKPNGNRDEGLGDKEIDNLIIKFFKTQEIKSCMRLLSQIKYFIWDRENQSNKDLKHKYEKRTKMFWNNAIRFTQKPFNIL